MIPFKKIMITLDRSSMDEHLVEYAAVLNEVLKPEMIYFLHVEDDLDMPDELRKEYPLVSEPFDEELKEEIQSMVQKHFGEGKHSNVEIDIVEGAPLKRILHWAHIKRIDLLISGVKKHSDGSGVLPKKIARKSNCSVLFVPENPPSQISKILVPIDYSEYSEDALLLAIDLKQDIPDTQVKCVHSFQVPLGYYKTGKSYEEFADIMEGHAKNAGKRFLSKKSLEGHNIDIEHKLTKGSRIAEDIQSSSEKMEADLVIMGSRGKSGLSLILIGSVAEKFAQLNRSIPLLLVKHKNEMFDFTQALEEM